MTSLGNYLYRAEKLVHDNSPAILAALGVSGTLTTAYLAAKASFRAGGMVAEQETMTNHRMDIKELVKATWRLYIPAGVSGVLTVGCIIGATKIGLKRTAAAYSLLSVSEKAFIEYKEKVVEQIGAKKEQAVRDDIAQDRVNSSSAVVIAGTGTVLCYEMHTGRYFNCDMETLRKSQNTINAKLIQHMEASLSDFYYLVGLPSTSYSSAMGWTSDKMLDLQFSTVMSEDSKPCIAFEYNYVKTL